LSLLFTLEFEFDFGCEFAYKILTHALIDNPCFIVGIVTHLTGTCRTLLLPYQGLIVTHKTNPRLPSDSHQKSNPAACKRLRSLESSMFRNLRLQPKLLTANFSLTSSSTLQPSTSILHRIRIRSMTNFAPGWDPISNPFPTSRRSDDSSTYESQKDGKVQLADPYSWLEQPSSENKETREWTEKQAQFTANYLNGVKGEQTSEERRRDWVGMRMERRGR